MPDSNEGPSGNHPIVGTQIQPLNGRAAAFDAVMAPEPPRKRPSSPKVLGIILIVGASLLIVHKVISSVAMIFVRYQSPADMPDLGASNIVSVILNIGLMGVLSLVALAAGIGLVRYRAWGRILSIVWAVTALVCLIGIAVVNLAYIMPASARSAVEKISTSIPGADQAPFMAMFAAGALMEGLSDILLSIVPILILIFITRRSVKQACR